MDLIAITITGAAEDVAIAVAELTDPADKAPLWYVKDDGNPGCVELARLSYEGEK